MRLVLFAVLVLVSVISAEIILSPATPKPAQNHLRGHIARAVGGPSRRSRDTTTGKPRNGIGSPSNRKGRDVSKIHETQLSQEIENAFYGLGSPSIRIRLGRDLRYLERDMTPVAKPMSQENKRQGSNLITLISRMQRDTNEFSNDVTRGKEPTNEPQ